MLEIACQLFLNVVYLLLLLIGVPPLVSRRVLETLTYLARSHPNVAKLLLFLEFPCPSSCRSEHDQRHGKAVFVDGGEEQKSFALVLLLTLLNQPLYMRSVAHLEQVDKNPFLFRCVQLI